MNTATRSRPYQIEPSNHMKCRLSHPCDEPVLHRHLPSPAALAAIAAVAAAIYWLVSLRVQHRGRDAAGFWLSKYFHDSSCQFPWLWLAQKKRLPSFHSDKRTPILLVPAIKPTSFPGSTVMGRSSRLHAGTGIHIGARV